MDNPSSPGKRILTALAAPLVFVAMVPLALVMALVFYALAVVKGVAMLFRPVPEALSHERRPHFLSIPTVRNHLD